MDEHFELMLRWLRLTTNQRKDARTKYQGVAKTLHNEFYETTYSGSSTLLIGSYGKKTNIRPPADVDLLFKIPADVFEKYYNYDGNGPSALLQDIRTKLKNKTYTTTEKISAWGKVVLVQFSEGDHNVELLPAYEVDGVFMIPNTEDGGSWESFDARADLKAISESQTATNGKTRPLIKFIKRWRNTKLSIGLKSYEIENLALEFLDQHSIEGDTWSEIVVAFFGWLNTKSTDYNSYVSTANAQAIKARELELNDKPKEACAEWRKVFGNWFPAYDKNLATINQRTEQYPSNDEEYIEDLFGMKPSPEISLKISAEVEPPNTGWRQIIWKLEHFLDKFGGLPKTASIKFRAITDHESPAQFYWKVRNFGPEASNDLRGKIMEGTPDGTWREETKYHGTHYIECYLVAEGQCIAFARRYVPIKTEVQNEQ